MIDTIFYFIDHLPFDEYLSKIGSGDIANHTIVFVDDTKAIYKGGLWFGSTSDPDNTEKIILLIRENEYHLPTASSLVLGGVKVGNYLTIDQWGILKVDVNSLPKYDDVPIKDRLSFLEYIIGSSLSGEDPLPNQDNTLLGRLSSVEGDIIDIRGDITDIQSDITDMEGDITSIRGDIISIEGNITTIQGVVTNIQGDITTIRGNITTIRGNITDVERRITTVETAIANIKEVTVNPILNSGVKIATITVGNVSSNIYAPSPTLLPEPGSQSDPYSYNDSELRNWLDRLEDEVDQAKIELLNAIDELDQAIEEMSSRSSLEKTRLDGVIQNLNSNIELRIRQLFADALWVQNYFPDTGNGSGGGSVSNFGTQDVESYLQLIGVWARNGDVTKTEWSSITLRLGAVEISVNQLLQNSSGSEALLAYVRTYVDEQIAGIENGATYARTDDLDNIIEWLYSGMKAESSPNRTYSQIVSAALNNQLGNTAIAGLWTEIRSIENNYVATTALSTSVNSAIATLILEVKPGASLTSIINLIDTNKNNISAINSEITSIEGSILSESYLLNSVADEITGITSQSQIKSRVDSEAKTAAATMLSTIRDTNGNVTAESIATAIADSTSARTTLSAYFSGGSGSADASLVETIVNTRLNASVSGGSWSSWVNSVSGYGTAISALLTSVTALENSGFVTEANLGSKITSIDKGTGVWAGLVTSTKLTNDLASATTTLEASIAGKVDSNSASIILAVNGGSGSSAKISADKVDITGTAVFKAINGSNSSNTTTIEGSMIKTGSITADKIIVSEIVAAINNSTGSSKLTIDADHVNITGSTIFGLINGSTSNTTSIEGSKIKTGTITADKIKVSEIVAAINSSTGSSKLTIDADHLNITGSTIFGLINGNNGNTTTIEGSKIKTGTITADQVNLSSIVGAINSSTGSSKLMIDADNVNITGSTIFGLINGNNGNTTTIEGSKIKTGTITASLINSSNLHVNAANIDGTLTVTAANVSGLTGAIQSTEIDGSKITTGTISAARIDATDLHVEAANIDGTISANKVDTTNLAIGDPTKYTISTNGTRVSFNYQSTSNAYFTSENGGMQLYIKGPGGDWYSVDFSKWNNITNPQPSYPSHSLTLYKLRGGGSLGIVSSTKTIYYESNLSFDNTNKQRRFGKCYTDEQGLNPATSSTLSGKWYYAPQDTCYFALVRTNSDSTKYEPVMIRPLLPVTINDIGILLAQDKDTSVIYAAGIEPTADLSTATTYILAVQDSPISVDNLHIYSNTGGDTPIGATTLDALNEYDVYPLTYTNMVPTAGPWHVSVLSAGTAWMVTTVNTHA